MVNSFKYYKPVFFLVNLSNIAVGFGFGLFGFEPPLPGFEGRPTKKEESIFCNILYSIQTNTSAICKIILSLFKMTKIGSETCFVQGSSERG